jgi:homoserine kinase
MPSAKGWRVRVPASSANLGPGFDALGMAISSYLTVDFAPAAELHISAEGRDASSIPCHANNLIWLTAIEAARREGRTLPSAKLHINNDIPLGKGLGSSAAALIAGVVIADRLLGLGYSAAKILEQAARIEGHPDNVAAAVLGSIIASAMNDERVHAIRLEIPDKFHVAVVSPDFELPTSQARTVLPNSLPRTDAVFNVQRSALLIAALATGDVSAFPMALEDRLHQPWRAPLVPGLQEMLALRAPGLLGCCLSGAGPSVLVLSHNDNGSAAQEVVRVFAKHGHKAEVIAAGVDRTGIVIEELHES